MRKIYFTAAEIANMGMNALPPCAFGVKRVAHRRKWQLRTLFGMPLAQQRTDGEWTYHRFLIVAEWLFPCMQQGARS